MSYPDFNLAFTLYTDTSLYAVGSILAQKQHGQEKVIGYASHALLKAETKWSAYDHELWAIVWLVRHFRHNLRENLFTIITDHKPLMGLGKTPVDNDPTGRRAWWTLVLDMYN